MNKLVFWICQIYSNIEIKWMETSTYTGIVGLFTVIATICHYTDWKEYLMIAGGIISFLHILFPNSLQIDAMDEAMKEKHGNVVS